MDAILQIGAVIRIKLVNWKTSVKFVDKSPRINIVKWMLGIRSVKPVISELKFLCRLSLLFFCFVFCCVAVDVVVLVIVVVVTYSRGLTRSPLRSGFDWDGFVLFGLVSVI